MANDKLRVAIVGGGRTGAPLIEDFLKRPFIEVVGVADKDADSPGAALARKEGIWYTTEPDVLAAKGYEIDLLFELSGDPSVKPVLKDAFQAQDNRSTIIVQDVVARLIRSLVAGSDELLPTYHPEDTGIG